MIFAGETKTALTVSASGFGRHRSSTAGLRCRHLLMHSEVQLITPEKAKQLLALNVCNRHLVEGNVEFFTQQLLEGSWKLTHQGIAITKSGHLADGQHRLTAIVKTGVAVEMMVTTDLDDEAFAVLDTGRARRAADAISIVGGKNSSHVANAIRLAYCYENWPDRVWIGTRFRAANGLILERYERDKHQWDRVVEVASAYALPNVVVPGSFACLLFLAEKSGVDPELLLSIAKDLRYGASLPPGDPALAYRNKLSFSGRVTGQARLADYIKLLNARMQNQSLKIFKQQQFPPMPTIAA